jgi:O-6-methylguanine DNA methyltransferase
MIIYYTEMDSPLGPLYLGQHTEGLCLLSLGEAAREKFFSAIEKAYPQAQPTASKSVFQKTMDQLAEYFAGTRSNFDMEIFLSGTEFQKQVWNSLRKIPYGQTISYGDLAKSLNKPGAMRAVGAANGQNPVPIIIPCHRVIAADGSLGGYTGGLDIKAKLLDLEQQKFTPTLF